MELQNRIVNYFAFDRPEEYPLVYRSPVTVNAETARKLLEKQKEGRYDLPLHVCYDVNSRLIYLPNRYDHSYDDEKLNVLFTAVKFMIIKEFGDYRNCRPIEGSPFSSLRVRSVQSFPNMSMVIQDQFKEQKYDNLLVLEVNLSRMPSLLKFLPKIFSENEETIGGYIGTDFADEISFSDEIDGNGERRANSIHLLTQKTPFILLNVSPVSNPSVSDKEWGVLSGYRDYLSEKKEIKLHSQIARCADLYTIKRYLTQGWPFEEVCLYLLTETVTNFGELIKSIMLLTDVARSLKEEGYANPASNSYYYSFKIDRSDFPWDFSNIYDENGKRDEDEFLKQSFDFFICDYDLETSYVLIKSPAFIPETICETVLNARSMVFIGQYSPNTKLIEHKGGKVTSIPFKHYDGIRYLVGREFGIDWKKIEFDMEGVKLISNPLSFKKRKISDYYYACDFIRGLCCKNGVDFADLEVVVGPVEQLFGEGTQGGFMDKILFAKNGFKSPHEITKGISISAPVIFMNSISMPSYSEQAETLVHEYRHYIYSLCNSFHDPEYNKIRPNRDKDFYKYWKLYLSDANEVAAHKAQIEYALLSGQSADEIIRDKVGGQITTVNYPIALRFAEIVEDAANELKEESYG